MLRSDMQEEPRILFSIVSSTVMHVEIERLKDAESGRYFERGYEGKVYERRLSNLSFLS